MAIVKPFSGVRFDLEKVLLKSVIAPPYDVIADDYKEVLKGRSPYNIVRLDLPDGAEEKYDNAGALYREYREKGVLVKDSEPSFYLYEQIYEFGGKQYIRTGFVGRLKLEELGKGTVFPHEKTLSGPKKDRFELMKTTETNLSQIFGLYMDEDNRLNAIFNDVKKNMPAASAVDDENVKNTIWQIDDENTIQQISSFMKDRAIYIADGHHRYETALNYRDHMREKEAVVEGDVMPYDYVMMMFVNFYDEGLKIFPTHRVLDLKDDFSLESYMAKAGKLFTITELADKAAAQQFLSDNGPRGLWVMAYQDKLFAMRAKEEEMENLHPIYRKVDTYLLQEMLLTGVIGKPEEEILRKEGIYFWQDFDKIRDYVAKNNAAGFVLRGVDIDIIREVSENGLVMPQKSTYFYPKLATGLVINEI